MRGVYLAVFLVGALWSRTLTVVGTGDLQGVMSPAEQKIDLNGDGIREKAVLGGIARLATVYKRLKRENPDTLVFSAGDDLMGRYFQTFHGTAIFTLMSAAGYDYFVFGNHEFDHGPEELANALEVAKFGVICSDLNLTGAFAGKTSPWVLREIAGTKVGIFSMMTEGLAQMTSPGTVRLKASNVKTARAMVRLLRAKGAKVVIALTHIGYTNDVSVAKQVKGIDLIFGGHSHVYPRKMGRIGKTAIVNGGEQGPLAVRVDLPLDDEGGVLHRQVTMRYIPVDGNYTADPAVQKLLESYEKRFPPKVILGRSLTPWDLSEKTLRKNESGVADMINDLLRRKFHADIVLNNSGAFRGKTLYPAGPVSDRMLRAIDAFRNNVYLMTLKGKRIREILEHSAAKYGTGGWLQVSGLRFTVDLRRPKQRLEGEKILRPGHRVRQIRVWEEGRWKALEDGKEYRVLSNAFMVLRAGDGYYWFRKYGRNPYNTYTTFYSIMAEELHRTGVLSPPAPDGRITILR